MEGQQVGHDGSPISTDTNNQHMPQGSPDLNEFSQYLAFETQSMASSISSASPHSVPTRSTESGQYSSTNNAQVQCPPGYAFNQNVQSAGHCSSSNIGYAGAQWTKQPETQSQFVHNPIGMLRQYGRQIEMKKQDAEILITAYQEIERGKQQIAKAVAGSSLNLNVLSYCRK